MNAIEDIKYMYNKLKNGEVAWLTSSEIEEVKSYAYNANDTDFLDACSFEDHIGNGIYKCYLQ